MSGDRTHATLQDQLEAMIADRQDREAANPGYHRGDNWWQLSDAEAEVFQIDYRRFPRMVSTWYCYEAFKKLTESAEWDDDLIEQERRKRPAGAGQAPRMMSSRTSPSPSAA